MEELPKEVVSWCVHKKLDEPETLGLSFDKNTYSIDILEDDVIGHAYVVQIVEYVRRIYQHTFLDKLGVTIECTFIDVPKGDKVVFMMGRWKLG
jgi:hypothetical protein